jgi:serine protease
MKLRALVVGSVFLWLCSFSAPHPGAQNLVPEPGTRIALYPGLPAIDRGVRTHALATDSAPPEAEIVMDDDPRPYVPGRVIVKFRPGLTPTALAAVAASVGGRTTPALPYANFRVITIDPDADAEAAARDLASRPDVEYAQAAYEWQFHLKPNDPLYSSQWNMTALDMERVWDINPGATSNVVVAVLDSGIAYEDIVLRYNTLPIVVRFPDGTQQRIEHGTIDVPFAAAPDLGGRDRFVAPFDFTWNDAHPVDTLGHGTHVAGTIGQLTNNGLGVAGMAFNVRIMPVKVAGGSIWDTIFRAPGAAFTDDQIARAIRYAADNGAKAMNMSFGRSGPPAPVVEDAVRYAVSRGAFCVISAGNGGRGGSPLERLAEIASRVDGAIAVAAVGPALQRAPYSSVGSWVEISAPGGDIAPPQGLTGGILQQTLDNSLFATPFVPPRFDGLLYAYNQGTSMAAPHVTGFAALLVQQGITNPAAIEAAMKKFATDKGPAGRDDEYGAGVINPRATLRGLGVAR